MNYFGLIFNELVAQQSQSRQSSSTLLSSDKAVAKQSKLYLVDLPGFGYANAPDANVDKWQERTTTPVIPSYDVDVIVVILASFR